MNSDREVTNIVRSWLEDGVTSLPDRVLDDVIGQLPRTYQRRSWWPPRRIQPMTYTFKALAGIAAVVVALVIGFSVLPGSGIGVPAATPSPSPTQAPAPASPSPSASAEAILTAINGARISVVLPAGWTEDGWNMTKNDPSPLAGTAVMFASVENMFSDPCFDGTGPGALMDPPLGPTVDDLATGLSRIPGTTASEPVSGTIAGLPAKVVDFTIPAENPCGTSRFYLWEDDPGGYTWAQGVDEVSRTRVFEIDGQRVLLRTLTWGGTNEAAEAELQAIVDTVRILPAVGDAAGASATALPEAILTATNGARISVALPAGWHEDGGWALLKSDPAPLAGMGVMFASPENMFSEPCLGARKLMDPPLGPTVDDLVTGLTLIPGTTASEPVSGTVAGLPARVVDFTIPANSRCGNVRFYLWEDDPGGFTWAQDNDEVSRTRVFEIDGQRVLLRTLTWRGTNPEAEAELQSIVDSVRILPATGD